MRFLITYLLLLACSVSVLAQKIAGTGTEARTGEPLPYVNVYYKGERAVQTNEQGFYSIPFKTGELNFSYVGYNTKTFTPKRSRILDVMLEEMVAAQNKHDN